MYLKKQRDDIILSILHEHKDNPYLTIADILKFMIESTSYSISKVTVIKSLERLKKRRFIRMEKRPHNTKNVFEFHSLIAKEGIDYINKNLPRIYSIKLKGELQILTSNLLCIKCKSKNKCVEMIVNHLNKLLNLSNEQRNELFNTFKSDKDLSPLRKFLAILNLKVFTNYSWHNIYNGFFMSIFKTTKIIKPEILNWKFITTNLIYEGGQSIPFDKLCSEFNYISGI
jgi:DNA-binding PadR family transcriptional regulator